jgi:hypothetical protein
MFHSKGCFTASSDAPLFSFTRLCQSAQILVCQSSEAQSQISSPEINKAINAAM